jgi:hypothetical protein
VITREALSTMLVIARCAMAGHLIGAHVGARECKRRSCRKDRPGVLRSSIGS